MTATGVAPPPPLAREKVIILVVLLGLAATGWGVFVAQTRTTSMADGMDMASSMGPDLTMGRSWPLFASMWVAMMVAMMFPAAAPMVLLYARMRRGDRTSVALFTASYISLWFAFGVVSELT